MAKYNWNEKVLKKRYSRLSELAQKTTDEDKKKSLLEDMAVLKDLLKFFRSESRPQTLAITKYKKENPSETINKIYDYFNLGYKEFKFLWNDFKEFDKLSINRKIKLSELKECNLELNDLFTLVHDFYHSLNPYFYENFMKNFIKRNTNLKLSKIIGDGHCAGITNFLVYYKEAYINAVTSNNIWDFMVLAHEYCHATSCQINNNQLKNSGKIPFDEIDTTFIELLAADYYDDVFKNNKAPILKSIRHRESIFSAKRVNEVIDIINLKESDVPKEKEEYLKTNINSFEQYKKITSFEERYVIGYIVAIELYQLYQKDKEKALDIFKQIILLDYNSMEENYNAILNLGIIPNEHLEEYQDALNKSLIKARNR